jgi:hypothetical protein
VGLGLEADELAGIWAAVLTTLGSLDSTDWGLARSFRNCNRKLFWACFLGPFQGPDRSWDVIYPVSSPLLPALDRIVLDT